MCVCVRLWAMQDGGLPALLPACLPASIGSANNNTIYLDWLLTAYPLAHVDTQLVDHTANT